MNKDMLGQLMRQAQQVQQNVKRVQDELAATEITGAAGGGLVKVTLNGKYQARKVEIDPAALTEGKEFLEDLVAAAVNSAVQKVEEATREKLSQATGGLPMPPGLNF